MDSVHLHAGQVCVRADISNRFTVFEFLCIHCAPTYSNKTLTLVRWKKAFILPVYVYNIISNVFLTVSSYRQGNYSYPYKDILNTLCLYYRVI